MKNKYYLFALPILLVLSLPLFAQPIGLQQMPPGVKIVQPPQKMQNQSRTEAQLIADRARRTEERGNYEQALQMWKDLLSKFAWNPEAVQGAPRCMLILKRYDEAEAFIKELIRRNEFRDPRPAQIEDPTSSYALNLRLGEVALARGKKDQAWKVWNEALVSQSRTGNAVRMLVNTLQMDRMWEDGDSLIRDYRKQTKDAIFMALELANSLRAQMNFASATEELLLFSRTSPAGWSIVINYLDRFPDDTLVTQKVSAILEKSLKSDRKNPDLWRIFAAYKFKAGELEKSLNATITADSLSNSQGSLILASAQTLLKEKDVALARRGYERALKLSPSPEVEERAELGLGECLESLGQWTSAQQSYEAFVQKHSKSRAVDEAKLRIANILLEHEKKPNDALAIYQDLWKKPNLPWRSTVGLRIGDCHAWLSEFDAAIKAWRDAVSTSAQQQLSDDGAQAMLRMARANFWRDSIGSAQDVLDNIVSGNPSSSTFNDAILYNSLLDEGGVYKAVRAFAQGDFEMFKGEFDSAAVDYSLAAGMLKISRSAEWCRYQEAMSLRAAGKPMEAIAVLDTFITSFPSSVDLDRSVYMKAVIRIEDLNEGATALESLQKFLIDYPRSPYLEQARRRARILTAKVS